MASKKPKMAFKVLESTIHGSRYKIFWPADTFTKEWMASQTDDALHWVTTHKPRSPQFHRAVHKLCSFLCEHLEAFKGMDAHSALKRLQLESRLYCDETQITIKDFGVVRHLIPQSISFDNMDEAEFRAFFDAIVNHVSETHWPEFSFDLLEKRE